MTASLFPGGLTAQVYIERHLGRLIRPRHIETSYAVLLGSVATPESCSSSERFGTTKRANWILSFRPTTVICSRSQDTKPRPSFFPINGECAPAVNPILQALALLLNGMCGGDDAGTKSEPVIACAWLPLVGD
jgi:hypothetical protein